MAGSGLNRGGPLPNPMAMTFGGLLTICNRVIVGWKGGYRLLYCINKTITPVMSLVEFKIEYLKG